MDKENSPPTPAPVRPGSSCISVPGNGASGRDTSSSSAACGGTDDSGRFAEYSDEAIDQLIEETKNKNTSTATKKWLAVLSEFCRKRNLKCDLATITGNNLAGILKHAYVEIRTKNDQKHYSKASLISFRAAIQRRLTERHRDINILTDKEFVQSNKALHALLKKKEKGWRYERGPTQGCSVPRGPS